MPRFCFRAQLFRYDVKGSSSKNRFAQPPKPGARLRCRNCGAEYTHVRPGLGVQQELCSAFGSGELRNVELWD